ncbi:MFS transporter [Acidiplasma sp.]|uniref:MFS transporter n=1 Tax=Acidiplasma sp. TaxID=1872114 RepID=UPI0031677E6A
MENKLKYSSQAYLIYSIFIIVLLTLAVRASNNMMMTTISLFAKYDLYFNQLEVGLTESVMALATFITTAIINTHLSAFPRRVLFIASNITFTIILAVMEFSNNISVWIFIFVAGFALGAIMPNIITFAGSSGDKKVRERILGIYTLALSVSLIAGPAYESYILNFEPLRYIFLYFVPFGIVASVFSFFIKFPDENIEKNHKKINVFGEPGFKVAVYAILAYNIVFALLITFGGIYAKSVLGFSYSQVTLLFTGFFIISFSSRLFYSIKTPENLWHYIAIAMLVTLTGIIAIFFSKFAIIYIIAYLMLGIPHGVTYPLSIVSISRTFDMSSRNVANSYFFSVMMLIGIITPSVGGFINNLIGFRNMFIILVPVIIYLIIASYFNIKRVNKNIH